MWLAQWLLELLRTSDSDEKSEDGQGLFSAFLRNLQLMMLKATTLRGTCGEGMNILEAPH